MALSAAVENLQTRPRREDAPQIADAVQIYRGGWIARATINDSTTAKRGRAHPFSAAKNRLVIGVAENTKLGDITPAANLAIGQARLSVDDNVEYKRTIAGLAGDVSDEGRMVWLTDDGTYTFTPAALAVPLGPVTEFIDSTNAWFRLATNLDLLQFCANKDVISLGIVSLVIGTATVMKSGIPVPRHCDVEAVYAFGHTPLNTSATSVVAQLQINNGSTATSLTGGTVTVTTANDAIGNYITATAVTAANVAHEGETFQVLVTPSTVDPTAGDIEMFAVIRSRLGT